MVVMGVVIRYNMQ